ncbi:MAG TPA: M23 family metallopeptidase [Gemmatimonadales bacterium]
MRGHWANAISALVVGLAGLTAACEPGGGPSMRFIAGTPHQEYAARLRQAGLHATALGRDWMAAADRALAEPVDVDTPHLEARFLDPARATAVAYRLVLERGQRLVAHLDSGEGGRGDARFFLDLFFAADTTASLQLAATGDSAGRTLEYVALRPGTYVLRVQPELLRGGRVTLSVTARASLGFPVAGRDMAGIRSGFGAPRDAGRREHQGVDIFAPRGTPVVAAVAGRVSRVSTSRLGGNVVWLREDGIDRRLYYAHLDRHAVLEGAWVRPGDTLGFVGNTGNARTTPPHLHFGIYMRGLGPVDPHFHLYDPPQDVARFAGDSALVGRWARIGTAEAAIRARPGTTSAVLTVVPGLTPVELLAGSGGWYRARLPNGREGYVAVRATETLTPLEMATVVGGSLLRAAPRDAGAAVDSVGQGDTVPVFGRFGAYALVQRAAGPPGWLGESRLEAPAVVGGGEDRGGAAGGR